MSTPAIRAALERLIEIDNANSINGADPDTTAWTDAIADAIAATPPLSPAAQAIVKAFDDRYELLGPLEEDWQEQCIAAALRAATGHGEYMVDPVDAKTAVVRVADLQAWATELEAANA